MKRRRVRLVILLILLILVVIPLSAAADYQNLLSNGSFEAGWRHQGAAELFFPDPWRLEYRDGDHPWCPSPCKRPEVTRNEEHVADGVYSVRAFAPAHSRALFTLYQAFEGEPGSKWTFACHVRATSLPEGGLLVAAAIHPYAGSFFDSWTIRGEPTRVRDQWTVVSVTAPIWGDRGKAGIHYQVEWPTQNNTIWVDDCALYPAAGDECLPCDECPEVPSCPTPDGFDWVELYKVVRQAVRVELGELRLVAE